LALTGAENLSRSIPLSGKFVTNAQQKAGNEFEQAFAKELGVGVEEAVSNPLKGALPLVNAGLAAGIEPEFLKKSLAALKKAPPSANADVTGVASTLLASSLHLPATAGAMVGQILTYSAPVQKSLLRMMEGNAKLGDFWIRHPEVLSRTAAVLGQAVGAR
jgi:hypothetical protein